MATPILSLLIYRHNDPRDSRLHAHTVASGVMKLDPRLDSRVALLATSELAKASPAFAADLEAQTHFLEHLEKVTKGITDKLVIPDDLAALNPPVEPGRLGAKHIAEQVLNEQGLSAFTADVSTERVYDMLQRAVHLARE